MLAHVFRYILCVNNTYVEHCLLRQYSVLSSKYNGYYNVFERVRGLVGKSVGTVRNVAGSSPNLTRISFISTVFTLVLFSSPPHRQAVVDGQNKKTKLTEQYSTKPPCQMTCYSIVWPEGRDWKRVEVDTTCNQSVLDPP